MSEGNHPHKSALLASKFRNLRIPGEHTETPPFFDLENSLLGAGFTLGAEPEVGKVLDDNFLLCRSESFSRVMDLILEDTPLLVTNNEEANMCTMAGGEGFRVAMQEGFSGKDVDGVVKVVLSFAGDHLETRRGINKDDPLWATKPNTASVSLAGGGEVFSEDIRMVSFRFPIHHFPKEMLSETEQDALEEGKGAFVVRHYLPTK